MRQLLLAMFVLAACSKDNSPHGLCERGCKKVLGCMNADAELEACMQSCAPQPPPQASVEELERTACETVLADPRFARPGAAPAAPAGRPGCAADCHGCVGDDSSCYMAAGGANGIPCDPCCCAPGGGGAPVWKTPE